MDDNQKLTKQAFVNLVKEQGAYETKADAEKATNAMILALEQALSEGYTVPFVGFGTFDIVERSAREGRNPQTGEKMHIKASKSVRFKPGAELKKKVQ